MVSIDLDLPLSRLDHFLKKTQMWMKKSESLNFRGSLRRDSRIQQGLNESHGLVLAIDVTSAQVGKEIGNQIQLLSDVSWSQVESLLVSESAEPELTWYARQEIAAHLPQWFVVRG